VSVVNREEILERIRRLMVEIRIDEVKEAVDEALRMGIKPLDIIDNALTPAIREIGDLFEKGEYFLPELIISADLFKEIMDEKLKPLLTAEGSAREALGRVVIGTVKGDLHDIGKNIVATMLEIAGFEVYDLGVDVAPEEFVRKAKEVNADIVAMSALLTTTMIEMKNVIELLKREGLRDKVKVIVGGAPVTEEFARQIGADAYAEDAVKAVEVCKKLVGEKTGN